MTERCVFCDRPAEFEAYTSGGLFGGVVLLLCAGHQARHPKTPGFIECAALDDITDEELVERGWMRR